MNSTSRNQNGNGNTLVVMTEVAHWPEINQREFVQPSRLNERNGTPVRREEKNSDSNDYMQRVEKRIVKRAMEKMKEGFKIRSRDLKSQASAKLNHRWQVMNDQKGHEGTIEREFRDNANAYLFSTVGTKAAAVRKSIAHDIFDEDNFYPIAEEAEFGSYHKHSLLDTGLSKEVFGGYGFQIISNDWDMWLGQENHKFRDGTYNQRTGKLVFRGR